MIEILFALTIAGILIGLVVPSLTSARDQHNATGARDALILLSTRAQAEALKRSEVVSLELNIADHSAEVYDNAGTTLEQVEFDEKYGARVSSAADSPMTICYGPRGFAKDGCTGISDKTTVEFTSGERQSTVVVWPLGQMNES